MFRLCTLTIQPAGQYYLLAEKDRPVMPCDHTPRGNIDSVLHLRGAPLHEPLFYGWRTAEGTELLLVTFMNTYTKNTNELSPIYNFTCSFIHL